MRGRRETGFTLIELLVTCAILAALAFTAWSACHGAQEAAEDDIALVDLRRLADALRRFRADTGYYPGQGPFVLAAENFDAELCKTRTGVRRDWAPAVNGELWFSSPANLAMLFESPPLCGKLAYLRACSKSFW